LSATKDGPGRCHDLCNIFRFPPVRKVPDVETSVARDRASWLIPLLALVTLQISAVLKLHGGLFAGIEDADTLMRLARINM